MDPAKIKAILERKPPTNQKQVQEFLGLPNYYRRYIRSYAEITYPINNLLKKETPFLWDLSCTDSFEKLKMKLTEYPILRQPNFSKKFVLHCDASGFALGVILTQLTDDNNNYLATDWVVAYGSRLLKDAELNYGITQKECLAIVWGIKHFHTYLYGVKFTVVTDHIALSWLNHTPVQNGRLARWAMYLQEYDFDIVYRKGKKHGNVDAISRPVLTATVEINAIDANCEQKILEPYEDSHLLHYLKHKKHLPGTSKRQIKRILKLTDNYKLDSASNELFYRKSIDSEFLKVPKLDDRMDIIEKSHLQGHFNTVSTANRIK